MLVSSLMYLARDKILTLMNHLDIYTVIAPWLTVRLALFPTLRTLIPASQPILQQATGALGEGSKAVIDSDDQYEVRTHVLQI